MVKQSIYKRHMLWVKWGLLKSWDPSLILTCAVYYKTFLLLISVDLALSSWCLFSKDNRGRGQQWVLCARKHLEGLPHMREKEAMYRNLWETDILETAGEEKL